MSSWIDSNNGPPASRQAVRSSASDRPGFIVWIAFVVVTTVASESEPLLNFDFDFAVERRGEVEVDEEEESLDDPELSSSL
jgi:hypothetical protein